MAFINADGSEATKDMGQLGVEQDGSVQGVVAISLKEHLGRRANRVGGAGGAASAGAVTINNAGQTQLCQAAAPGAGMRHHLTLVSLLLLGGAAGTDWASALLQWAQDDGAHSATILLSPGQTVQIALEGQIVAAQNGTVTLSAQAGTATAMKVAAALATVILPSA